MSFSFVPPRVPQTPTLDWQATAAAWRGCCLEVFSRAERSIDDCIAELEERGRCVGRDTHHQGAKARGRALAEYLEREPFTPHGPAALRELSAWTEFEGDRPCLAHGEMTVRASDIAFRLHIHEGKKRAEPVIRTFNRFEMLAFLREIDAAQHALHAQLGQIRAAARRAASRAA